MLIFSVTFIQWLFELMHFTLFTIFPPELPNNYMTSLHFNNKKWMKSVQDVNK